ncbi:MAG: type 4a pilus biogenesis protein PilO [Acutalibacteraceae bacterium]
MKNKKIDLKEIKNSPYTSAAALVLVIILVIAIIVYLIVGIFETKQEIVATRESYQNNLREIATLEELRAQSEKAQAQLEIYKGILPDELGDVYILQEDVIRTCKDFSLDISAMEVSQVQEQTQETKFVFSVQGTFENIYNYMAYVSSLEQMHRFDSFVLTKTEDDKYNADISLAVLSQNGAEGIIVVASEG